MFYLNKKYGDGFYSKFLFFELHVFTFLMLDLCRWFETHLSYGPFYQNIQKGSQLMKSLHYRVINGLGFKSTTFSSHEKQKGFDKIVCSSNYLRGQMSWKKQFNIYSLDLYTK